jgi:5-methylcytosine-specific restriction endonuclease McrA
MGRNIDKVITFITKAARTVNIADKFRKDIKYTIGRIKSAKRRPAKRKPAKRKHIPKAVRDAVMERDNYTCVYCASTNNPELDHNEAHAKGGSDDGDNLQVLCRSCNRRKGAS